MKLINLAAGSRRQKGRAGRLVLLCVLLTVLSMFTYSPKAQVRSVYDQGAAGLGQMLRRLNTTASVMMIGAHPDDEDSALLAYLARGASARTAYLSLTRGDGGQNIIGPELFESLGIIRTEELLQARRLDGAEQYFGRAFDYGFSKTLAEAKQKWDEKVVLCDTVRAIRLFRPMVVLSRFSGTTGDGHGQHQYSGYISPLAVKAAGDPGQCAGSGTPWRVSKFYTGQRFAAGSPATLRINTGQYDPLLGRTYFQVAMDGRTQHQSQSQGRIEFNGDQFSGLNLVENSAANGTDEKSIFDGLDTSLTGIAAMAGASGATLTSTLVSIQKLIDQARGSYNPYAPEKLVTTLAEAYKLTRLAAASTENAEAKFLLGRKQSELVAAIRLAAGLQVDALVDRETAVPGENVPTAVKVFVPRVENVMVKEVSLITRDGWPVSKAEEPKDATQGFNPREAATAASYFNISVPANARATQPYWLNDPRDGDLFRWPAAADQTMPFQQPLATANIRLDIGGTEITITEPVSFRYADAARGEVRRNLNVVPALSIDLDQKLLIVPQSGSAQTRSITMSIANNSMGAIAGVAGMNAGADNEWVKGSQGFNLKRRGEKVNVVFDITIPAGTKPGSYWFSANALVGEALATQTMHTIAYPHIQTHRYYTRAETFVNVIDLKTAPTKVGYIMGSGDEVPAAIRQMGLDVTMIDEKELGSGDLSVYDTIVVGIRASETRPDFAANNQRLLDYVTAGGNLIVQYQRPAFAQQNMLPYPATMGPRVVDENAAVTILEPAHPVFNFPNKISNEDFNGWVQERNLYNFNTFDERYMPLLEAHDAGEAENKGGLMVARVGKGTYIYNSYSFFRQLPAGVGGAYRLFANMLALPKAPDQASGPATQ